MIIFFTESQEMHIKSIILNGGIISGIHAIKLIFPSLDLRKSRALIEIKFSSALEENKKRRYKRSN